MITHKYEKVRARKASFPTSIAKTEDKYWAKAKSAPSRKNNLWNEFSQKQILNDEVAHESTPNRSHHGHCHLYFSLHCLTEGGNVKIRETGRSQEKRKEMKPNLTNPTKNEALKEKGRGKREKSGWIG